VDCHVPERDDTCFGRYQILCPVVAMGGVCGYTGGVLHTAGVGVLCIRWVVDVAFVMPQSILALGIQGVMICMSSLLLGKA
jgi:hypothetical protein